MPGIAFTKQSEAGELISHTVDTENLFPRIYFLHQRSPTDKWLLSVISESANTATYHVTCADKKHTRTHLHGPSKPLSTSNQHNSRVENIPHLPRRCVQIFPVSVWILNIDLKQAANEGSGGLEKRRRQTHFERTPAAGSGIPIVYVSE